MTCGICQSEWHFRAKCPQNKGKGGPPQGAMFANTGAMYADQQAFPSQPALEGNSAGAWHFYMDLANTEEKEPKIYEIADIGADSASACAGGSMSPPSTEHVYDSAFAGHSLSAGPHKDIEKEIYDQPDANWTDPLQLQTQDAEYEGKYTSSSTFWTPATPLANQEHLQEDPWQASGADPWTPTPNTYSRPPRPHASHHPWSPTPPDFSDPPWLQAPISGGISENFARQPGGKFGSLPTTTTSSTLSSSFGQCASAPAPTQASTCAWSRYRSALSAPLKQAGAPLGAGYAVPAVAGAPLGAGPTEGAGALASASSTTPARQVRFCAGPADEASASPNASLLRGPECAFSALGSTRTSGPSSHDHVLQTTGFSAILAKLGPTADVVKGAETTAYASKSGSAEICDFIDKTVIFPETAVLPTPQSATELPTPQSATNKGMSDWMSQLLRDSGQSSASPGHFPWWPGRTDTDSSEQAVYHSRAHLPTDDEAVLVDTGAWDNLAGSEWVKRQTAHARAAGYEPQSAPLDRPMDVQGVGKGAQQVTDCIHMPGRLENGQDMTYSAPVVPDSQLPALWGYRSMQALDTVIDCRKGQQKVYMGPDVQIIPGPKTMVVPMHPAESGHLMVPISSFNKAKQGTGTLHLHETSQATTTPTTTTTPTATDDSATQHRQDWKPTLNRIKTVSKDTLPVDRPDDRWNPAPKEQAGPKGPVWE